MSFFDTPSPVNDGMLAGRDPIGDLIPAFDQIPAEYRDPFSQDAQEWVLRLEVREMPDVDLQPLTPEPDVDPQLADAHLRAIFLAPDVPFTHKAGAITLLAAMWFS